MFQLKLPMATTDLNMLINSEDGVSHDSLLAIGISQASVEDAYKWLHQIHIPFTKLVGDDYDVEPINEFAETLCGLWQLRVLAHLGGSYLKHLKEKLLSASKQENFTTLEFARAIYNAMPKHKDAMDPDFIFQSANSLVGGLFNYYYPLHMTYPESGHVSEEAIITVTMSVYQMLAAMSYVITQRLDSINASETEDALYLKRQFSSLATAIEAEHIPPMYPLLLLVDKINTVLKNHHRKEIKQRQNKLGLRLI